MSSRDFIEPFKLKDFIINMLYSYNKVVLLDGDNCNNAIKFSSKNTIQNNKMLILIFLGKNTNPSILRSRTIIDNIKYIRSNNHLLDAADHLMTVTAVLIKEHHPNINILFVTNDGFGLGVSQNISEIYNSLPAPIFESEKQFIDTLLKIESKELDEIKSIKTDNPLVRTVIKKKKSHERNM